MNISKSDRHNIAMLLKSQSFAGALGKLGDRIDKEVLAKLPPTIAEEDAQAERNFEAARRGEVSTFSSLSDEDYRTALETDQVALAEHYAVNGLDMTDLPDVDFVIAAKAALVSHFRNSSKSIVSADLEGKIGIKSEKAGEWLSLGSKRGYFAPFKLVRRAGFVKVGVSVASYQPFPKYQTGQDWANYTKAVSEWMGQFPEPQVNPKKTAALPSASITARPTSEKMTN